MGWNPKIESCMKIPVPREPQFPKNSWGISGEQATKLRNATVESLFTDPTTRTAFNPNTIDLIHSGIIDLIVDNSRYIDCAVIEPIIVVMPLYVYVGGPDHRK